MGPELFTNKIEISASEVTVSEVLLNLKNILMWDREITDMRELDEKRFMVLRNLKSLNAREFISVTQINNQINYVSTRGKVEYVVIWTIDKIDYGRTRLTQTLHLKKKNKWVPISQIIRPIVQAAFVKNLRALKQFCEMEHVGR
ncbi:SRPBCC family protein [Weissella cibaria]|uniref:SRPBCC family protein n=1 Tax=Weissella cibaria TaxID=137591 RepID=UPI001193500C|nr:SRPBCC family protein [Weissella cibaria]TVV25555.1 SRPBCC family protein [Weissella cibaria]